MILSDDEIMVINQTAEFDSAIGYARAIEAKVIEKLSDKLRDAELTIASVKGEKHES